MKQKYVLTKSGEKETLTISEYTELEKKTFSLICEESHDGQTIRAAIAEGTERLISTFRTHNMYPRMQYAEEMAVGIKEIYRSQHDEKKELVFDDKDAFNRSAGDSASLLDVIERESVSVDALIVDDEDAVIGDIDLEDADDIDADDIFDDSEPESPEDES
ncbi:MAG: hypothetical protein V2B19_01575 [Pseudomonadota bacterium]